MSPPTYLFYLPQVNKKELKTVMLMKSTTNSNNTGPNQEFRRGFDCH